MMALCIEGIAHSAIDTPARDKFFHATAHQNSTGRSREGNSSAPTGGVFKLTLLSVEAFPSHQEDARDAVRRRKPSPRCASPVYSKRECCKNNTRRVSIIVDEYLVSSELQALLSARRADLHGCETQTILRLTDGGKAKNSHASNGGLGVPVFWLAPGSTHIFMWQCSVFGSSVGIVNADYNNLTRTVRRIARCMCLCKIGLDMDLTFGRSIRQQLLSTLLACRFLCGGLTNPAGARIPSR